MKTYGSLCDVFVGFVQQEGRGEEQVAIQKTIRLMLKETGI